MPTRSPRSRSARADGAWAPGAWIGLAAVAVLCVACGASAAVGVVEPEPVEGGVLRYPLGSDPAAVTPLSARTRDELAVTRQLFAGLVDVDPDSGGLVPALAESWTVSKDLRTFVFDIRPGAVFAGGAGSITAGTFVRDWGIVCSTGAVGAPLLAPVRGASCGAAIGSPAAALPGVRALGRLRLQVQLDRPFAEFPALLANPGLWAFPPDRADSPRDRAAFERAPLGAGPFTLASWTPGEGLRLTRNPQYAGPTAHLEAVEFPVMTSVDVSRSAMGAFRSGGVDVARVPVSQLRLTMSDPELSRQLMMRPLQSMLVLVLEDTAELDLDTRRALALGADAPSAAATSGGADTVADSFIPYGTPGYVPGSSPYRFDPVQASGALAAEGLRRLAVGAVAPDLRAAAVAIARGYRAARLRVEVQQAPAETTVARLTATYPSQDALLGPLAAGGEAARLVARARATADSERRDALYGEAAAAILGTARVVPLANEALAIVVSPRVQALRLDMLGLPHLAEVWLREADPA